MVFFSILLCKIVPSYRLQSVHIMRGSRKFCQRGPISYNVFCCVYEGREDPNDGPPAKRQFSDVSLASLCWPNIEC